MDISEQIVELTRAVQTLAQGKAGMARTPSMAGQIGQHASDSPALTGSGHPWLKASLDENYRPGDFLTAIINARSRDAMEQAQGKAGLAALGLDWRDIPDGSSTKATLGGTGATGGYVLPNNFVEQVTKPATGSAVLTQGADALLTVRPGVAVRGVDVPYRTGAPSRMTFSDWGVQKENLDEAYGSYSASLGTMARLYDIGKQYARFSAGSAEADVVDELTKARDLGETFYALAGAGTGTGSSGDPTTGIYTALTAPGIAYTTAFSAASSSTIAKSAGTAMSQALSALAGRSRRATAVLTDAVTYWTILSQGSDTAGYWLDPKTSGGFTINADGGLALWGVPIVYHPNFDSYTGSTKAAIAADFRAFRFYRGSEFRIDTSDQAGTRWDLNLIGFRGEQEVAFTARPGVLTGAAQLITGLIP